MTELQRLSRFIIRTPGRYHKSNLASHGNANEKKPYYATWPSTVEKIKKECLKQGPKSTVECLSSIAGGLIDASAPGQLPRDNKQLTYIYIYKKVRKQKGQCGPSSVPEIIPDTVRLVHPAPSNSSLLVQQHLKVWQCLTITASFSMYRCSTQISLPVPFNFRCLPR